MPNENIHHIVETLRQLVNYVSRHLWHLAKWLGRHSWDWGAVLFVVAGLWGWGYFVVSLAIASAVPSAVEIAVGGLLLFLGTIVLFARIIHAAWSSAELPSIFQRLVVTVFVLVILGGLNIIGYRYLSSKVPTLNLDLSAALPSAPEPPRDALPVNPPHIPSGPRSYLEIDGPPKFAGRNPNGIEGSNFQVGDPIGFNVHIRATGPNAVNLDGSGFMALLEPNSDPKTLAGTYKVFADQVAAERNNLPKISERDWMLFTPDMSRFNSAIVLDGSGDHRTMHLATEADLDNLKSGAVIVVVIAFFNYRDGNQIHQLWFCSFLQPPAQSPGIWHYFNSCPNSN